MRLLTTELKKNILHPAYIFKAKFGYTSTISVIVVILLKHLQHEF